MDRATFLSSLALPSLLVNAVPSWLIPAAAPLEKANKVVPLKEELNFCASYLYSGFIAGLQYYAAEEIMDRLRPGLVADLVREPNNEHDYKAIAIYALGQKIGYLQRRHNLVLSNILDAELPIYAEISRVNPDAVSYEQVRVRLYLVGILPNPQNKTMKLEEIKPGLPRQLELTVAKDGTFAKR